MDKEIILQSLIDAFEIIKDSWTLKNRSIINCIVETEVYNGSLAMEMWQYILKSNERLLTNKEELCGLIDNVFERFVIKYDKDSFSSGRTCAVILNHIIPHLKNNETLIDLLFGKTIDAGVTGVTYRNFHYIPGCMACLLLQEDTNVVRILMKALCNNPYLVNLSIADMFNKISEYINDVYRMSETYIELQYLPRKYEVSQEVKETLMYCLDQIKDKEERAECTIAILSL